MIIIHADFDLKKRKNRQLNNIIQKNKYFYYKLFFKKLLIIFIKLKLFNLYKYKN